MKKNGNLLIAIVRREKLQRGIWDPYRYRENGKCETLADYASVERLNGKRPHPSAIRFAPIEYKHIPSGNFLTFILEPQATSNNAAMSVVPEQTLLFGTMRGYLGNIVVTPKAEWLGLPAPLVVFSKIGVRQSQPQRRTALLLVGLSQIASVLAQLASGKRWNAPAFAT
jgi:hypothetical protein